MWSPISANHYHGIPQNYTLLARTNDDLSIPRGTTDPDDKTSDMRNEKQQRERENERKLTFIFLLTNFQCMVFWTCLAITFSITALTVIILSGEGNPITRDMSSYDLHDKRSVAYESFYNAIKETISKRNNYKSKDITVLSPVEVTTTPSNEEGNEEKTFLLFYESQTAKGMFTPQGLKDMRETETLFTAHPEWPLYCKLSQNKPSIQLPTSLSGPTQSQCTPTMSATTIFYASEWDIPLAKYIIDNLSNPGLEKEYNNIIPCVDFGKQTKECGKKTNNIYHFPPCAFHSTQCSERIANMSQYLWHNISFIHHGIQVITGKWDGTATEPVSDIETVSLFCAHLARLPSEAPKVAFFVDKNFEVAHPTTEFSRAIIQFGEPRAPALKSIETWVRHEILNDLETITVRSHSIHSDTAWVMRSVIFHVVSKIIADDALRAIASAGVVFVYLLIVLRSLFLAVVGMLQIMLSLPLAWVVYRFIFQIKYFSPLNALTLFLAAAIGTDDIFVFFDAYQQSANEAKAVTGGLQGRLSYVWRNTVLAMLITSTTTAASFASVCVSPLTSVCTFGIFTALVVIFNYLLVITLFASALVIFHNRFERPLVYPLREYFSWKLHIPSPTEQLQLQMKKNKQEGQKQIQPTQDNQFCTSFNTILTHIVQDWKSRSIILFTLTTWTVVTMYYATQFKPTNTSEQYLPRYHPIQKAIDITINQFETSPTSAMQQTGLGISFVWGLDGMDRSGVNQFLDTSYTGKTKYNTNFVFTDKNNTCPTALKTACDNLAYDTSEPRLALMQTNSRGHIHVDCFLYDLPTIVTNADTNTATEMVVANATLLQKLTQDSENFNIGWDGQTMKYAAITVYARQLNSQFSIGEDETREQYELFTDLANYLHSSIVQQACGEDLKVTMTDKSQMFIFMHNQFLYRSSLITGTAIGLTITFTVVFASTFSLPLSLISVASVLAVVVAVTGTLSLAGWELGTIESILITVVSGMGIDFVVHLTTSYQMLKHSDKNKNQRIEETFQEMGTPILHAMITTVTASIPLFTCTIVFFSKFGIFMLLTILYAWLYANFFFMSLLSIFGSTFNLKHLLHKHKHTKNTNTTNPTTA